MSDRIAALIKLFQNIIHISIQTAQQFYKTNHHIPSCNEKIRTQLVKQWQYELKTGNLWYFIPQGLFTTGLKIDIAMKEMR